MLVDMNKRLLKSIIFLIVFTCTTFIYTFFTRPVSITSIVNSESIKDISISIHVSARTFGELPANLKRGNLKLDNKQDFEEFINILNKYKYSKAIDIHDGWFFPYPAHSSDAVMNIFIGYLNVDNQFAQVYVFVDAEDDAYIGNLVPFTSKLVIYKIRGKSSDLFKDLSNWLSEKQ